MKDTMCSVTTAELLLIDAGAEAGTYCGIAVGATVVLAFINPLTLFFTAENAAAVCAADYLGR
jgi:hypothetical protein